MDITTRIKEFIRGEADDSPETLKKYSHDASLFEVRPKLVVFPKDVEDIKNLVKFTLRVRNEDPSISLTARSAGSDMSGGPLTSSIVVELTRHINRFKEIGSDFAVVEPGIFYKDFEKKTLERELLLPSYPASRELCAIGGMIANNSGGEKTLAYGKTEDYVQELKMILSDGNEYRFGELSSKELEEKKALHTLEGELYRKMYDLLDKNYELLRSAKPQVTKNSAGYYLWDVMDKDRKTFDLTKLIVGSQGTLGIITEARLKLIRPYPHTRLLVIFLKDVKLIAEVAQHVLKYKPESFESYDDNTFKLGIKLFPDIAKKLKGNIIRLAFSFLPEFWMALTGGIPKLVLLAEFTGNTPEEAKRKADEAEADLKKKYDFKTKVTKSNSEAQKYWVIRRESFNLLRHHVKGLRTAPFIDDFVVKPEDLPRFMPKLYSILDRYNIFYTIAGHVGNGNFHIIPLMDLSKPEAKMIIKNLSEEVYKLIYEFHGSTTGEHNDGLIRSPFLKMMYGEKVYNLFEETKKIFDPDGIFNPHKKIGVTLDYALSLINTNMDSK
ncbi:MAG: FAD-binding oxidoreductase [bacterium]|nr:FAD-binding oxidoreductase [bacterium]